jgi:predicted RNA-binding Zn ribbon-like protein
LEIEGLYDGLPQVGGHPALDLMNTVEYRGRPDSGDRLTSLDRLLSWCELAGQIDDSECRDLLQQARERPDAAERALQEVRELREYARHALAARMNGTVDVQAMGALRERIERAARCVEVVVDGTSASFRRQHKISGLDSLVDRVALMIEDAFNAATRHSLRECEGVDCDWLFFDRSRSARRRWCHSGQCGNAERVRNFRARQLVKDGAHS